MLPIVAGEINERKAYFLLNTSADLIPLCEQRAGHLNFKIKSTADSHNITRVDSRISCINHTGSTDMKLGTLT
jgi:hypothetical protein